MQIKKKIFNLVLEMLVLPIICTYLNKYFKKLKIEISNSTTLFEYLCFKFVKLKLLFRQF